MLESLSSWNLFDKLLHTCNVVGTPGSGFGAAGEGYFRISAFNSREAEVEIDGSGILRIKISPA